MTLKQLGGLYLLLSLALVLCAPPCRAAVYVVDQAHPGASDENPGTETAPWATIARSIREARPGDTVCVMAGSYPERAVLTTSGAPGRPIVFRSRPAHGALTRGFECEGVSHVRIEGFSIRADTPADRTPGIDLGSEGHVEVVGNDVAEMYMGISGGGRGCLVARNRTFRTQYGLLVGAQSVGWTIERNDFRRQFQHRSGDCDYSRMWGKDHVVRYNRYHDTRRSEVGQAHLDCIQTFNVRQNPDQYLQNLTFERNVCSDFSQGFMLSTSLPGTVHTFMFRQNIFSQGGSWGLNVKRIPRCTSANNTFYHIKWYGFGNAGGENGRAQNNIFVQINTPYTTGPGFVGERNLVYECDEMGEDAAAGEFFEATPRFADAEAGNFRLTERSAAIDAGIDGADVGALDYPNVYYVDVAHPAADDEGYGYGGWPFRTLGRALSVARDGETIVVREGVYRESVDLAGRDVSVTAAEGEVARICTAALVTGWKRPDGRWVAPLPVRPERLLHDGRPLADFDYDEATSTLTVRGFDPRLHAVEVPNAFSISARDADVLEGNGIRICESFAPPVSGQQ